MVSTQTIEMTIRLRRLVLKAAIRQAMRWTIRSVRVEDSSLVVLTLPTRTSFAERCAIGEAFGDAIGSLPARNVSMLMLPEGAHLTTIPAAERAP